MIIHVNLPVRTFHLCTEVTKSIIAMAPAQKRSELASLGLASITARALAKFQVYSITLVQNNFFARSLKT